MRLFTLLFILLHLAGPALAQQDAYDLNKITEIKIRFKEDKWDTILDSLKQTGENSRLTGDVWVNGVKYEKVGVRYKGNSSYANPRKEGVIKLPFNIKLDEVNKQQHLPSGHTTLKLSNSFRDPSFVREVLSYEIAGRYMPAPRANFAKVYVNDQYLGVYHNVESVDSRFLLQTYNDDQGVLIKCDPDWSVEQAPHCPDSDKSSLMYIGEDSTCYMRFYELKDKYGWKDLIAFTKILNQQPEALEKILQIDETLWMLAFNNVLVNLDSYTGMLCHNYYLYRDTQGVYHTIIWDLNMSFGGFRYLTSAGQLSLEEMQKLSPFVHYTDQNSKRPLIVKLLANPLYRKIYVAHIRTILEEQFANGAYLKRATALQQFIDKHIQEDQHKLYTHEAFQANLLKSVPLEKTEIVGIAELMNKRAEYLLSHPLLQRDAPTIQDVKHKIEPSTVVVSATIQQTNKAWLFYRAGKGGAFQKLEMTPDNATVWMAIVPKQKDLQYYIVAEGERTASVSPARASFEYYRVETPITTSRKAK